MFLRLCLVCWVGTGSREQLRCMEEPVSLTEPLTALTTHVRVLSHAVMMEHKLTVSEVWRRCNNAFGAGELIPGSFPEPMLSMEGHELGMSA